MQLVALISYINDCSFFFCRLGAPSYSISSACETSCGGSGAADSESTATCASTGREAVPGGTASAGMN